MRLCRRRSPATQAAAFAPSPGGSVAGPHHGHLHEGVDGDRTTVDDDERVEVGGDDRRIDLRRGRQRQEHVDQGDTVDRGLAAEGTEKSLRVEVVDHLGRVDRRDRHQPEHDVGDSLGQDSSDTEHDRHAELRIEVESGDELSVPTQHRCDQQMNVAIGRRRRGQQLGGGSPHGLLTFDAEPDKSSFGLVSDGVAPELERNLAAQLGSRGGGPFGVGYHQLGWERNAVAGEQALGLDLRQRRHSPTNLRFQGRPEEVADVLEAGVEHLVRQRITIQQRSEEGRVAEVAEDRLQARDDELLGVVLAHPPLAHLTFEEGNRPIEERFEDLS